MNSSFSIPSRQIRFRTASPGTSKSLWLFCRKSFTVDPKKTIIVLFWVVSYANRTLEPAEQRRHLHLLSAPDGFGVANIDRQTLFNNVLLLAKSAKIFKVPTILTTVESKGFFGALPLGTPSSRKSFLRLGLRPMKVQRK
jgi:hypothetical protein